MRLISKKTPFLIAGVALARRQLQQRRKKKRGVPKALVIGGLAAVGGAVIALWRKRSLPAIGPLGRGTRRQGDYIDIREQTEPATPPAEVTTSPPEHTPKI